MHNVNKAAAGNVAFIPLAILLCIHALATCNELYITKFFKCLGKKKILMYYIEIPVSLKLIATLLALTLL